MNIRGDFLEVRMDFEKGTEIKLTYAGLTTTL
jgi:hypothetical protein